MACRSATTLVAMKRPAVCSRAWISGSEAVGTLERRRSPSAVDTITDGILSRKSSLPKLIIRAGGSSGELLTQMNPTAPFSSARWALPDIAQTPRLATTILPFTESIAISSALQSSPSPPAKTIGAEMPVNISFPAMLPNMASSHTSPTGTPASPLCIVSTQPDSGASSRSRAIFSASSPATSSGELESIRAQQFDPPELWWVFWPITPGPSPSRGSSICGMREKK
mmetsp:Transcript_26509/g.62172  ORF Transcript_26509/g.62172 Transcript_26509/m.62172 type:complete len:226 (-) Transcript_26509:322-999(-)